MSRQVNRADIAIFLLVLVLAELLVDAIAGDYIKQWVQTNIGTSVFIGVLAVIVAVWLRYVKYSQFVGGGGKVARKNFYGGVYNKGNLRTLETILLIVGVLTGIAVFGLGNVNLAWITDWSALLAVIVPIGILAADKERKPNRKITAVEIIALIVAIFLPLAAAGHLASIGIDVSQYLADPTKAFVMFLGYVGSLIVIAKQD